MKEGGGRAAFITDGMTAMWEVLFKVFKVGKEENLVLAARANISPKEGRAVVFTGKGAGECGADPVISGGESARLSEIWRHFRRQQNEG